MFNRVLQNLDPEELKKVLEEDGVQLLDLIASNHINFDGKKIKGVSPKSRGNDGLYIVSAWVNEYRICIGQEKVEGKSNKITAIPKLIETIYISGNVVTIDAIGCQTAIASKIIEHKGDYILSVKKNQGTLYEEIIKSFKYFGSRISPNEDKSNVEINETWEYEHGRFEKRKCRILNVQNVFYEELIEKWLEFKTIIEIVSQRTKDNITSTETRYYISSIDITNEKTAAYFNSAVRGHWGIENRLHWHLDVTFGEDKSRARSGYAPENLNTLRKLVLYRVSQLKDKKSINKRRYKAALNEKYPEKILFNSKLKF